MCGTQEKIQTLRNNDGNEIKNETDVAALQTPFRKRVT